MRYMRLLTVGLLPALFLFAASCGDDDDDDAQAPDEVQLTQADDGTDVALADGGTLIVALPSNPSTGFAWAIVAPEPSNIELDGQPKFVPPGSTTPVVGAPGTEVFTFKTIADGTSTLKMEYRRSFEPNAPPGDTFSVEVEVR
jgi:inhibitor of cysteine peptidase